MVKVEQKNDRYRRYYDLPNCTRKIYNDSKVNKRFNNLMKYVYNDNNIKLAIKRISSNSGRNIPGPDGLTFNDIMKLDQTLIETQVKLRLQLQIKPQIKTMYIPKSNKTQRKLGINNIYDRIAQQCVLNILESVCEPRFINESMGFRPNLNTKRVIAQIANSLTTSCIQAGNDVFIIEGDLEECFNNIDINIVLDTLRYKFNVHDSRFLRLVKGLIWVDYEKQTYKGIGVPQGSILGPILCNILLHNVDEYVKSISFGYEKFKSISGNYRKWIRSGGEEKFYKMHRGIYPIRYYRYADDFVVLCPEKFIADDIKEKLKCKFDELKIKLNERKTVITHFGNNKSKLDFLGFKIAIKNRGIIISPKDIMDIKNKCKNAIHRFVHSVKNNNKLTDYNKLMNVIRGYMIYYDICTNLHELICFINNRLYISSKRYNCIEKVPNTDKYIISNKEIKVHAIIDLWSLRKDTKLSYSKYMKRNFWECTSEQEYFRYLTDLEKTSKGRLSLYMRGLSIRQNHMDPILNRNLSELRNLEIHHITPISQGGDDTFSNLIILSNLSHKMIHGRKNIVEQFLRENKIYVNINKLNTYRKKAKKEKIQL